MRRFENSGGPSRNLPVPRSCRREARLQDLIGSGGAESTGRDSPAPLGPDSRSFVACRVDATAFGTAAPVDDAGHSREPSGALAFGCKRTACARSPSASRSRAPSQSSPRARPGTRRVRAKEADMEKTLRVESTAFPMGRRSREVHRRRRGRSAPLSGRRPAGDGGVTRSSWTTRTLPRHVGCTGSSGTSPTRGCPSAFPRRDRSAGSVQGKNSWRARATAARCRRRGRTVTTSSLRAGPAARARRRRAEGRPAPRDARPTRSATAS